MQNTRLNTLVDTLGGQLTAWLRNPWRRISVLIISLLFGNYFANAIALVAGQRAELDIVFAAIMVFLGEIVSWMAYNRRILTNGSRPLWIDFLNSFKIGVAYGFAVEAFKLGS
jgi:small basic protein